MEERPSWDEFYLGMAEYIAKKRSKDPSTQTGAVITRPDKTVASVGFNGFPMKMPDLKEYYDNREEKYSRIVHCEMNALLFARERCDGYTLYTYPFLSCDRCLVHMAQAGIVRFVAPVATPAQLERWGDAFARTRRYAAEMGLEIVELVI